jgi:hypothetical protein
MHDGQHVTVTIPATDLLHLSQSNRLQPLSTRRTTCNNLSLRLLQNIGEANLNDS